ncbi:hypothetical protein ACH4SP_22790 [Streptomyces sp. NPDC021093]|uniref:hypothetical protein n=1 Tax=Streptomyces sp. NPDC021093 TaxID=3365112 RepID=UPI003791038A
MNTYNGYSDRHGTSPRDTAGAEVRIAAQAGNFLRVSLLALAGLAGLAVLALVVTGVVASVMASASPS